MNTNLLLEPHNFRNGDRVIVKLRHGNDSYEGTIHNIVNMHINKYANISMCVDYFYISFPADVYDKVLTRGLEVIHKNKPEILGNITRDSTGKITQLRLLSPETEINMNDIYAALIWRQAYEILLRI